MQLAVAVMVGVSDDEAWTEFTVAAKNTLINVLGVDLTPLVYRGKFVFVAQAGSPQKVVYELRDNSLPCGIGMDVLITGLSLKAKQVRDKQLAQIGPVHYYSRFFSNKYI